MRRKLFVGFALLSILIGCAARPEFRIEESTEAPQMGVYEFTFAVESVMAGEIEDAEFVFYYRGEEIASGQRLEFPVGVFSFQTIEVSVQMQGATYKSVLHVGVCDGGFGRTEMNLYGKNGEEVVYRIFCDVALVRVEYPPDCPGGHFVRIGQSKTERKFQKWANCTG